MNKLWGVFCVAFFLSFWVLGFISSSKRVHKGQLKTFQASVYRSSSECTLSFSKQACPLSTKKKGITLTSTQNLYCNAQRYIKLQGLKQKVRSKKYCFGEAFINDKSRYQTIHYRWGFLSLPVLNIFLGVKNRIFLPLLWHSKFWWTTVCGQLRAVPFKQLCLFHPHTPHLHAILSKNASLLGKNLQIKGTLIRSI